jgi:diguanylate cyclase (GGDEF)-like protein
MSSSVIFFTTRNQFKEELIENDLPIRSMVNYLEIQNELYTVLKASESLAEDLFIHKWLEEGEKDQEFIQRYLMSIKQRYKGITCFLASEKSRTYYDLNGSFHIDNNDPNADWYFNFKSKKDLFLINISLNVDMENIPTVFINYRILDNQGDFMGIAGLGISLESVPEILNEYDSDTNREVYFVNSKGNIIANSSNASIFQKHIYEISLTENSISRILSANGGFIEFRQSRYKYLLHSRYIEEFDWWLIILQNETNALKDYNRILLSVFFVSSATVLITLLLIFLTVRSYDRKMNNLIILDKLTGLFNRRFFEFLLNKSLAENKRKPRDICILIIDIDHFKKINDSLGHLSGDKVLTQITDIIQGETRDSDNLSRWGGEEFTLLIYDSSLEQGELLAEKIRNSIETAKVEFYPDGKPVTISIGLTRLKSGDTMDSFVRRADTALYKAKENGRNRIISFG